MIDTEVAAGVADRTAKPILEIGRAWMMAPSTADRGAELGLAPPFGFWVNGRAGALGEVPADVAAAAIGFMAPSLVERYWNARPEGLSARDAAVAYAEAAAEWGRTALSAMGDTDLRRLAVLAEAVSSAALPSIGALFAGWRLLPRPGDPAGDATVALNVLRELRGGAHLAAIQAAGLTPQHAVISFVEDQIRGGANGAERFGWTAPHPEPDVEARADAERMTTRICVPAYAALDPESAEELVSLVLAARACLD